MSEIGVIGGGAWGIALAVVLARGGRRVRMWVRDPATLSAARTLPRLPDHVLPPAVSVGGVFPDAAAVQLLVVPTQHLRAVATRLRPGRGAALIACCKGVERGTGALPGEILAATQPAARHFVLSGPNFADEIAAGLPAAAVLAGDGMESAQALVETLRMPTLRLYASDDPLGVQLGGAAKNVIAIAAGIAIGAGLGENARAALVTRGIAELSRLVVALGGQAATASGLSGIGDLLLTCTGASSRNFSLGVGLGRGERLDDVLARRSTVAEGVSTAPALLARARAAGVEMPIVAAVAQVLDGTLDIASALRDLMSRPLRSE
ncbi:glycerol-3-phosphate dehydrogenase (NAD(P)+) [Endobacter medicaginis]|uniref:Glycerol-3-phosphate dehydrogenase [NAD(P)+] n=2 Tax=Endobacter medicaginis TaxID=1181271 RepID=A0A839UVP1_9PROT|nr:NAD(P)H-dependent glycerol-3-phosphate dehydrogenase [Endobacter medicaginis]MBB3174378.1 glycerol-3-phosphate dehydrogenase (NAD(P)+) [Endobacter medicaginis]MCX5475337.1 NAD(P)-dependent glycerol-3-phosphate dehydrogenase [Endobacter medicaginis]